MKPRETATAPVLHNHDVLDHLLAHDGDAQDCNDARTGAFVQLDLSGACMLCDCCTDFCFRVHVHDKARDKP